MKYELKRNLRIKKQYRIDYENELNPQQHQAVFHDKGPALVIAGAGSGKTRTLIYRVARMVEDGVPPESILLLTFTRKASQEMLRRASRILDERCSAIAGGTFHSFASKILRQFAPVLGYSPSFTILDRSDSEDAIQLIRTQLNYHKASLRFPKKSTIMKVFSKAVNTLKPIDEVLNDDFPQYGHFGEPFEKIREQYQLYKRQHQMMDYDDLLVYFEALLNNYPDVRDQIRSRYRYVLVDEYQDTNLLQASIATSLCNEEQNLMVVGDDAQSIYSFRGAHHKNILHFPQAFENCKIITLDINYRSTKPVLDFSNELIVQQSEGFKKELKSVKTGDTLPVFIQCPSESDQSLFVCQKILELREEGLDLNRIAVLFRSSFHSNDLELELSAHGIPFQKHGGIKFIEAAHIKDVISLLKIILNPSDTLAWNRILLLHEGVGPKTAQTIFEQVMAKNCLPPALPTSISGKKYENQVTELLSLVRNCSGNVSPSQILLAVLSYYQPLLEANYDDFPKRMQDFAFFKNLSARFSNLEEFLTHITLEPPDQSASNAESEDNEDETLTLSTIHSAKGLEWDAVFVIALSDGLIPSARSLESEEQTDEELRLLYVAATRAKTNLFLTHPLRSASQNQFLFRYHSVMPGNRSRFLPAKLLREYCQTWELV
jgi:DNA helicase-2/ATP-dependent DNA helicase PcrA